MVEIDGDVFALNSHEWNGESYNKSWKCIGELHTDASNELYDITPIFELDVEDDPIIVGYNMRVI
ncbi:hypothetical protein [Bacillus toyonensis]|uniref:hypothetical protein n=1 Tax=Bacillus toyonensis TaxID=155322 RepID=UPI00211D3E1F|nr:hypothetical protein [Bacillus toyonensis]